MTQKTMHIFRRLALGSIPVVGLLLFNPVSKVNAQLNVFDALLATIGGMSGSLTTMQQVRTLQMQFEQNVLWPTTIVSRFGSDFGGWNNLNEGGIVSAYNQPVSSATLQLPSVLESQMFSATTTSVSPAYQAVYGQPLTLAQAPTQVVQSTDMSDAAATDSLQLSMNADSTIPTFVKQAQTLQSQGASSAPGVQPMLTAEAMASELQCLAQQHKLYASMLREEAARLGSLGMEYKQTVTGLQNTGQGVQNNVNSGAVQP